MASKECPECKHELAIHSISIGCMSCDCKAGILPEITGRVSSPEPNFETADSQTSKLEAEQPPVPPAGCICASFWTVRQQHKPGCPRYVHAEQPPEPGKIQTPEGRKRMAEILATPAAQSEVDREISPILVRHNSKLGAFKAAPQDFPQYQDAWGIHHETVDDLKQLLHAHTTAQLEAFAAELLTKAEELEYIYPDEINKLLADFTRRAEPNNELEER